MFRTIVLAAALGALALPAAAESVKVNIAGLDSRQAHAKILAAAQTVCRAVLRDHTSLAQFYERPDCIREAVARAETELASRDSRFASR
jgi:UrcA family protein